MTNKKSSTGILILFLAITVFLAIAFMPSFNKSVAEGLACISDVGALDDTAQTIFDAITYSKSIHILAMLMVGFGFLMAFIRNHEFSSLTATFLAVSIAIPVYMLIKCHFGEEYNAISINSFLFAEFAAASLLIAMGAVLGRLNMEQYFIMAILFVPSYFINEWLLLDSGMFNGFLDTGGSVAIHAFGAYFGLGMVATTGKKFEGKGELETDKVRNVFCLLGSMLLWLFWPSFTSSVVSGSLAILTAINTVFALAGSTLATFIFSKWIRGAVEIEDMANAALAGGVAIGSACSSIDPGTSMLIGIIAGIVSTAGYAFIAEKVCAILKGTDTCGVHNLHGMPGLVGGLSAIVVTGNVGVQLKAIVCTLVIALVLGRITGFVTYLFGTKDAVYTDNDDFLLEEE